MNVKEICEKLKPVIGDRAEKLHRLYLSEGFKGKAELEEAINLIRVQNLNEREILLPPPVDVTGDYPVADIIYNGKSHGTFSLSKNELCRHMAIFGTTGSGKTNACFLLIVNLSLDGVPFIITDFKQNYRDLLNTDIGDDIKIYTVGKPASPFHFNPLIPPKGVNPQIYINKLIDVINHSHFVSYGVDHLLQTAIHETYQECGMYSTLTRTPTFKDVLEKIKKCPANGRESLWKASAQRTLQDLTFGPVGEVFNTEKPLNIETILNDKIILELDALPQTTKTFFVEALLLQIYLHRINDRRRDEKLRHLLILEEAHHLLLKQHGQQETITDIFLREIRETGQGICMLDQSPSLISATALSNTNTILAMQLKHQDDIIQIGKALLLKSPEYFGMLKVGEAIVKTQAPQPFLTKFPLAQVKKGMVTDEMIMQHMKTDTAGSVSADSQKNKSSSAYSQTNKGIPETDKSKTQQVFGPENTHTFTENNIVHFQKLTEDEKEFLKDIAGHPLSGISSRYKRLSLSIEKGNAIKNSLIEKAIVKPITIPTNNGRILLLEPTLKGKEAFRESGIKTPSSRQGGVIHEYWKMKVANYYKAKGFTVKYEFPLGQGKTVDLVIEKDNQKTAIEIETGNSNAIENVKKCASSDFHQIICVATNPQTENQIREKLEKENIQSGDKKIFVIGCKEYNN